MQRWYSRQKSEEIGKMNHQESAMMLHIKVICLREEISCVDYAFDVELNMYLGIFREILSWKTPG